ncbi:MAG: hypothetical protein PHV82_15295 [Victivallaceae bacterium]|nr:hypothetical protein [Victivallaceae bacterium]
MKNEENGAVLKTLKGLFNVARRNAAGNTVPISVPWRGTSKYGKAFEVPLQGTPRRCLGLR